MAHPRVLRWYENLVRKLDDEEVANINRELSDNKGALDEFFNYDDDELDSICVSNDPKKHIM